METITIPINENFSSVYIYDDNGELVMHALVEKELSELKKLKMLKAGK